jgi:phage-related protein
MDEQHKRLPVSFYRSSSGAEPVRDWLRGLSASDRKIIGDDLRTLEFGWPIGMPLCRSIMSRKGLWEVRCSLKGNRIARLLFCITEGRLVMLHGFVKKSRKTPAADLDLATRRQKEVEL